MIARPGQSTTDSGPEGGTLNLEVINLMDKFSRFEERWHPHIITELNGQQVKLAKLEGEFVWHSHTDEDELFFVVDGQPHSSA